MSTMCEQEEKIKYLNSLGFEVISENLADELEVKCTNGHTFKRAFGGFKRGSNKCPVCETEEKTNFIHSLGFEVISENLAGGLEVECINGHTFKRRYDKFKRGSNKCPVCETEEKTNFINSLGYEVVSESVGHSLVLKCSEGHTFKRTYSTCKIKPLGCPICERNERVSFINSLGYEVISENIGHSLALKCSEGHTFKRRYQDFKMGVTSCPYCEYVRQQRKIVTINALGFKVLSENLADLLEVQCLQGHTFKRRYSNIQQGAYRCPICEREKENSKVEWLDSLGFEVLSENLADNLDVKCSEGHTFKRTFGNFKKGQTKCPICHPNVSSQELEIKEFLSSLGVEYQHSDWNIIKPQELDFYIPSHSLAIEFDGIYWHSELQGKNSKYHLAKTEICLEKGISLLHIFENEWMDLTKREIWKSIIKGKLGLHQKIGARKCILKTVPKAEAYEFLDANHLQGRLGCAVALGLYAQIGINDFDDEPIYELVNLMTFGKNRMGSEVEYELLRFASKQNVSVQGGASKLFKHFTKYHPGGVVSYSDRRYSQGNMYNKLGFTLKHNSKPNYFYFRNTQVLESRQKYMKHKLQEKLETFDPNLTEWENMKLNKFDRIWDCGNGVWVYNDNNNKGKQ